jgi:hypothetical protein
VNTPKLLLQANDEGKFGISCKSAGMISIPSEPLEVGSGSFTSFQPCPHNVRSSPDSGHLGSHGKCRGDLYRNILRVAN